RASAWSAKRSSGGHVVAIDGVVSVGLADSISDLIAADVYPKVPNAANAAAANAAIFLLSRSCARPFWGFFAERRRCASAVSCDDRGVPLLPGLVRRASDALSPTSPVVSRFQPLDTRAGARTEAILTSAICGALNADNRQMAETRASKVAIWLPWPGRDPG